MAEQPRKLSPSEFLAQLRSGSQKETPRSSSPKAAAAASAASAAPSASATAVAPPPVKAAVAKGVARPTAKAAAPARAVPARPAAKAAKPAAPVESNPALSADDLNLDFSDLDLPAPEPEAAEEAAPAEHGKRQTAVEAGYDRAPSPAITRGNVQLTELFQRVNNLLGGGPGSDDGPFRPPAPETLEETRLTGEEVERLILKFLLSKGSGTGRAICTQLRLPFQIVEPILKQLKQDQHVMFKGTAEMGDYDYAITDFGRERARRFNEECTYFGAAPVALSDYLAAMSAQSIADQEVTEEDLKRAFSDLVISDEMFAQLGPAINSGRGMFLFGEPGNGKTSIAERITSCFGSTIWIPRALGIDGDIIRLFDPGVHQVVEEEGSGGLFDLSGVDQRWVRIVRPTVIAGGELTMRELEVVQNSQTKICEAPLQLKSNCGTLVIDDFGRQTMPVEVLLNRWIVPLEKRYDFLNIPCGKKIQVPFDQLIIFSTNLEPNDLVDGAFLRRIPYKIEVPDPDESTFHRLFQVMAPKLGFTYDKGIIDYVIDTHYRNKRPFRACQPRDLLSQVKNFCVYKRIPRKLSPEAFDFAVKNYFSVL